MAIGVQLHQPMCNCFPKNHNRVRGRGLSHDYLKYICLFIAIVLLCAFFFLGFSNSPTNRLPSVCIIDSFDELVDTVPHGIDVFDKVGENLPENCCDIYCVNIPFGEKSSVEELNQVLRNLINENINLINMSFGMDTYNECTFNLLKQLGEKGAIIIAAAGNEGKEKCQYPAEYELDCVISVGAAEMNGQIASYSNYGKSIDVFVKTPNSTEAFSGTSAACAIFTNALLKANVPLNRAAVDKYIIEYSEIVRKGDYKYYYFDPDWRTN